MWEKVLQYSDIFRRVLVSRRQGTFRLWDLPSQRIEKTCLAAARWSHDC